MLSMYALIGAYKPEGHEWLHELKKVLSENMNYATKFISEHFKGVSFSPPEGTYMLFLDCTAWCKEKNKNIEDVENRRCNTRRKNVSWSLSFKIKFSFAAFQSQRSF